MMRFPLEQPPFAPLHLSDNDKESLIELADVFVSETLLDYERHLEEGGGIVDAARWQPVKRFENVTVYQDRDTVKVRRLSRDHRSRDHTGTPKDMQKLLWFGTIRGNLDDLMYGVINPTAEEAKVKAAYVGNNVLDFAVLDTIVRPTPDDPFRGLQLKWAVNGGPSMMRSMVRCRDFVYLESTGMTTSATGERIGYHILHSIAVPGVPELHEHKIVRGNMTLYHLYRQKSEGVVETYVKAFIDVMGDMPASVATFVSAKGVVSVWKLGEYAQMKKLNWMLNQRKAIVASYRVDYCSVCDKNMRGAMVRRKTCKICMARACSRCSVPKKMFYVAPQTRALVQKSVSVCMNCVQTATFANGLDIALDELTKKNGQHNAYTYWASASPTSSSSSVML